GTPAAGTPDVRSAVWLRHAHRLSAATPAGPGWGTPNGERAMANGCIMTGVTEPPDDQQWQEPPAPQPFTMPTPPPAPAPPRRPRPGVRRPPAPSGQAPRRPPRRYPTRRHARFPCGRLRPGRPAWPGPGAGRMVAAAAGPPRR